MSRIDPDGRVSPLSDPLPASPLALAAAWIAEARASEAIRNPDAMALATVDEAGAPEVRFVLCRGLDEGLGHFTFFTHYESPKARALERIGRASGALYWEALGRQLRFSGRARRSSTRVSDDYFASRPPMSQLAAWASLQSEPIATRQRLESRLEVARANHGDGTTGIPIPRPENWGGYTIEADRIELWCDRPGRLHDRAVWTRVLAPDADPQDRTLPMEWRVERLQP